MDRQDEIKKGLNLNNLKDVLEFLNSNECDSENIIERYEKNPIPLNHMYTQIDIGNPCSSHHDLAYLTWIYTITFNALYAIKYQTGDLDKYYENSDSYNRYGEDYSDTDDGCDMDIEGYCEGHDNG